MNAYKKILIINPFGIGDVLFTTPVIHALKDYFPNLRIGYLCNSRSTPILKNNPSIDYIFIYDRDEFELLRKRSFWPWVKKSRDFLAGIKKEHFDLVIDFSLNSQYGFFGWYAGIKNRLGYDFKGRGRFLTKKIKLFSYSNRHVVEYYADLIRYLGLELKDKHMQLFLAKEDIKKADDILKAQGLTGNDNLVAVIPGAGRSWGKDAYLKHWPAERFAALADKIIENYPVKIIILGDYLEQVISKEMLSKMRNRAIDLTGKTSISELAALLSKTKLVITNDGGPLHMASALGVNTVSIFGPVDEKVYGPYPGSSGQVVVKNDLSCRPCYKNFRFSGCSNNRLCIQGITVDDVYSQARRLL